MKSNGRVGTGVERADRQMMDLLPRGRCVEPSCSEELFSWIPRYRLDWPVLIRCASCAAMRWSVRLKEAA